MSRSVNAFVSLVAVLARADTVALAWIRALHVRAERELEDFEIVLVTADRAGLEQSGIHAFLDQLSCIRVIVLTQAVNPHVAMLAGFENAIGDYCIGAMPERHPVAELFACLTLNTAGADAVFAVSRQAYSPAARAVLALGELLGPSRKGRRLSPRHADGLVSVNRQTLNQFLASGRLQHAFYDRIAKVSLNTQLHDHAASTGTPAIPASEAWRDAFLAVVLDSTRIVRTSTAVGILLFAAGRILPMLAPASTTLSVLAAMAEVGAWTLLMTNLLVLAEYAYRNLEKQGQTHPYIVREELHSRIMNPLLKTNVVSEAL